MPIQTSSPPSEDAGTPSRSRASVRRRVPTVARQFPRYRSLFRHCAEVPRERRASAVPVVLHGSGPDMRDEMVREGRSEELDRMIESARCSQPSLLKHASE